MAIRKAQLTGTVEWSNGKPFDGKVVILTALPTLSGVSFASIFVDTSVPPFRIPDRVVVNIKNGSYDTTTRLIFTDDLQPAGCRYVAYFYDQQGNLIAPTPETATLFEVTATSHELVPPTLTAPTPAVLVPTP